MYFTSKLTLDNSILQPAKKTLPPLPKAGNGGARETGLARAMTCECNAERGLGGATGLV